MDNRTRHQLPPFHADVASWFQHIEAVFAAFPDYTDDQKYYATVVAIPTAIASRIAPTLAALPVGNKYLAVKKALLDALGQTRELHLHALEGVRYDGGRPSLLLQRLQALNTAAEEPYSTEMLKFRWLSLLPPSTRVLLADSSNKTLQECGNLADSIYFAQGLHTQDRALNAAPPVTTVNSVQSACVSVPPSAVGDVIHPTHSEFSPSNVPAPLNSLHSDSVPLTSPMVGAVSQSTRNVGPSSPAENSKRFETRLAALEASLERLHSALPPSSLRRTAQHCYYHRRFGAAARNCEAPCSWSGNGGRGDR